MPSKELLLAQATFLGVDHTIYVRGTDVLREDLKDQFLGHLKKQWKVKKSQESLEDYIRNRMAHFPEKEEDLHIVKTNAKEIREKKKEKLPRKKQKLREEAEDIDSLDEDDAEETSSSEEEDDSFEMQEGLKVYHQGGSIREPIHDVNQREGLTVGQIIELEEPPRKPKKDDGIPADLVGDRPPKTLADLYARWSIEEDPQFYLRVERTKPKVYQGVQTAGFVGTLRGRRYSEAEIARRFGGNEYKITLYGPDPRGRMDGNGNIKVKALTEPVLLAVPVYPPVIQAIEEDEEGRISMNPMNPFGGVVAAPTTQGDAAIHKANASFFSDAMKLQTSELQKSNMANAHITSTVLSAMTKNQETQMQLLKEQSEQRERVLQDTIKSLENRLEKAENAKGSIAAEVARAKDESNSKFLEYVQQLAPDKQAEIQRLQDYYNMQVESMRRSQEDQLRNLRESHQGTLDRILESNKQAVDRLENRVKEVESNYRLLLEQERSATGRTLDTERQQWTLRESQLREQMKDVTSAERSMAEKRIEDLKSQHAKEIQQMERAHEREIRTLKDSAEVKMTVQDSTHKIMLESAEQRLHDAKEEAERVREELEEAKDISTQLEKMERQAELLGYEKKDASEPKNAMERFAATAGAGVSQLFASADQWLPAALARRAEVQATQARMLQQQQMMAQQQSAGRLAVPPPPPPQPNRESPIQRRRPVGQTQVVSREPLGFQTSPPPPAPTQNVSVVETTATSETIQPPTMVEQNPEMSQAGAMQVPEFPAKFTEYFQPSVMVAFLEQTESAIQNQIEAFVFSDLLSGQYPDAAEILATKFEPQDIISVVESFNEESPLLRREGRKWLQSLWKSLRKKVSEKAS